MGKRKTTKNVNETSEDRNISFNYQMDSKEKENSEVNNDIESKMTKLLTDMFQNFREVMKKEMSELKLAIEFMSTKFDSIMCEPDKTKKEISKIRKENKSLRAPYTLQLVVQPC
mgnify:CR=1 FL=1